MVMFMFVIEQSFVAPANRAFVFRISGVHNIVMLVHVSVHGAVSPAVFSFNLVSHWFHILYVSFA
jgi:hypothetical protein